MKVGLGVCVGTGVEVGLGLGLGLGVSVGSGVDVGAAGVDFGDCSVILRVGEGVGVALCV